MAFVIVAALVIVTGACSGQTKPEGGATNGQSSVSPSAASVAGTDNPCRLITRAEAQSILQRKVAQPQERPLGPTCAYETSDSSTTVLVSVQAVSFDKIRPFVQQISAVNGLISPAFCGMYGGSQFYVVLNEQSVLNITGPCQIGREFAVHALARLHHD
jgi:hypothetical protein